MAITMTTAVHVDIRLNTSVDLHLHTAKEECKDKPLGDWPLQSGRRRHKIHDNDVVSQVLLCGTLTLSMRRA